MRFNNKHYRQGHYLRFYSWISWRIALLLLIYLSPGYANSYPLSSLRGQIVINEVLFKQSGANTAAEDEKDVSKVSLSLPLYEAYTRGYLSSAKDSLTETETEYMAFSSKLMTYECGIRFLGDYLNGDVYFKTDYPEHNLVRAKTQFALVADMEKKMDEMRRITENALK